MLTTIDPSSYASVRPVADGLHHHGMPLAVLAEMRPGVVLANDLDHPTALFIGAPEGRFAWTYFAGDAGDQSFRDDVARWLFKENGLGEEAAFLFMASDSPDWDRVIRSFLAPRPAVPDLRINYVTTQRPAPWRDAVTEGYEIRPIDTAFMASGIPLHEKLRDWFAANFGSVGGFLEHGVGAVAVQNGAIVAWCLADSVVEGLADVGVETEPDHQRKGLAYACTCQTIETALDLGIERIGWHCHSINEPSVRTAEKAGFQEESRYLVYPVYIDAERHGRLMDVIAKEDIAQGEAALDAKDFAKAADRFAHLFAFHQPTESDVCFHAARAAAATGQVGLAFERLAQALDLGWSERARTLLCKELKPLHGDPRWSRIVERLP